MRVGDVVTDDKGIKWVVVAVTHQQGKEVASKVRVGSLAAKVFEVEDK